ncbi:transmembrane protein, putative (macronuclear) [Tetrahymena thermophila SB210]|uniref:Transmembrane protein, putative n=1 Tax=Tetrahymena thermophila (strain SB210) TaxID=312017 RepID=Q247R4_TETTS|nr:transmembrane protein, putative [Tetrahymena thermophila SB210]EAS04036.2 transmembrane protein, putative [Tetrahymena thermophila SB210]|eukprot:XP_001024281.2 transmembrane protein, putative [Tetrahymena thermophila SB210]
MTNFIVKSFAKFDIFGSEVGLNYQKDNIFKTTFGGFMSLGFFVFLGIFFWNSIFSFLNKENVLAITNKQFYLDPPVVTLNAKNFMFAVQISQDNFLQNPYLNVTFETRDYVTLQNGTKIRNLYPTQLEPCTPEHWSQLPQYGVNWTDSFYRFNFKQFLCPTKDYQFLLGGSYNSEHFYHWKFSITKCSNNTLPTALWRPVCQSDEQIQTYFNKTQNIRFNIYTSNFVINALDSKNYVSNYIEDSIFFQIQNKNSYITSDIYFSENLIQTDQSLLPFPSLTNETIISFQNGNYRPQYVFGQIGNSYADFFIRKDPFVYRTNRAFQKISQIISYIGGFAQIFILVTAILVNYYNEYIYAISLANRIYDFQFQSKKTNKESQQISFDNTKINGKRNQYSIEKGRSHRNEQEMKSNNNKQTVLTEIIDLENQDKIKESQQEIDMNLTNKKQINREDGGLLPLDELKAIILQRKLQIEQQQFNYQQPKKSCYNQKQQLIKTEEQTEVVVEEEISINQIQIIGQDKAVQTNQKNEEIQQQQLENQPPYNKLTPANQIECKIVNDDSIIPETPLEIQKKNIFQSEPTLKNENQILSTESNQIIKDQKQELKDYHQQQQSSQIDRQVESNQHFNQDAISSENIQITYNQVFSKMNTLQNKLDTPKSKFVSQNNILLHGLGYKNQKQFLSKEFEFLVKKQATLQMTFKYFLYKMTCHKFFKTEQVLLLDKANEKMKQDLDIFTIMNKIKEIEKFKKLFLDKNQEILFNFFPKPVISIEKEEQNLTRAEIEEKLKENIKRDSLLKLNQQKSLKVNQQQQKKLNISIKVASLVQKAAQKFKKPLISKMEKYNTLNTYNMLYNAYEKLIEEGQNSKFNRKLIELLGDELSKIFEISTMLANKSKVNQKQNLTLKMCQDDKLQQQEQADLNSKRFIFTDQIGSLPSTERKLGFFSNYQ